jgi:hypothetical protein
MALGNDPAAVDAAKPVRLVRRSRRRLSCSRSVDKSLRRQAAEQSNSAIPAKIDTITHFIETDDPEKKYTKLFAAGCSSTSPTARQVQG